MSDPAPGDRQLAAWDAQHAEIERALGWPGAPRPVTPEVRAIAAAAERVGDEASRAVMPSGTPEDMHRG